LIELLPVVEQSWTAVRGVVSEATRGTAKPRLLQSGSVDREGALPLDRGPGEPRLQETAIHDVIIVEEAKTRSYLIDDVR